MEDRRSQRKAACRENPGSANELTQSDSSGIYLPDQTTLLGVIEAEEPFIGVSTQGNGHGYKDDKRVEAGAIQ